MNYQREVLTITAVNGEVFTVEPHLWQENQQREQILLRYFALPLKTDETTLWLALDSLSNLAACETFAFLTGKIVEPVLIESAELKKHLQRLSPQILKIEEQDHLPYNDAVKTTSDEQERLDEPVIRLLNGIFENALKRKASDIHFEPVRTGMRVRFRIDGVLQTQPPIAAGFSNRIISRLKLLARLDISETRLPQDGRFHFKTAFSDLLDFRLSTLPTYSGEKAVLRLQRNKPVSLTFSELGMTDLQQKRFCRALSQPQGLILVTGPTGSGKSISLYTALQWLNGADKHIMTAEDPIEIELEGIVQTQINPQIGLDFGRLLRTFLRQDPDVIMLGEIRDEESAVMALRAAQTGHLVLSTLHTNDAKSAISRLRQLGVSQHEIDSCLLLVVAQRLVRKKYRKSAYPVEEDEIPHQGYAGRIGVYQFLRPHLKGDIIEYQTDFASLRESALQKVAREITDLAEVNRVLGNETEKPDE